MADLVEIPIVVKDQGLKQAISTVSRLERELTRAVKAVDNNTMSQRRFNQILANAQQEYKQYATNAGLAVINVNKFVRAQQEAVAATKNQSAALAQQARANQEYYRSLQEASLANKDAAASADAFSSRIDNLRQKYNPLYAASKQYETMLDEIREAHMLGAMSAAQFEAAQEQLTQQFATSTGAFARYTSVSARGMNAMGVGMQQAGYQIGDFLVQVQSGTNAFVAFGQQATQLVGILPMFNSIMGISGARLIALSAGLGIAIPLITAIAAAFMRTRQTSDSASGGFTTMEAAMKAAREESTRMADEIERLNLGLRNNTELNITRAIEEQRLRVAQAQQTARDVAGTDGGFVAEQRLQNEQEYLRQLEEQLQKLKDQAQEINNINAAREQEADTVREQVELQNMLIEREKELSAQRLEALLEAGRVAEEGRKTREDIAKSLQQEAELYRTIARFGEGSAEVEALRAQQARDAHLARIQETTTNEVLITQAMQHYDEMVRTREEAEKTSAALSTVAQMDLPLTAKVRILRDMLGESADEALRLLNSLPVGMTYGSRLTEQGLDISEMLFGGMDGDLPKKAVGAVQRVTEEITEAQRAAEAYADSLNNTVVNAIDGVSNAWGDFVVRGFQDFKSFGQAVVNSFKNMIAQMIAIAAKNRIMFALGIGGVAPGAAMAGTGLLGGVGLLGGGGAGIGAAISGIGQGLSGVLGGGGLGASFANLGGLATGSIGGFGAIGAALPALGIITAGIGLLFSKTKELDNGIKVTVDSMDTLVESFRVVEKSRLFGLMKSVKTTTGEAPEEIAGPIVNAVSEIQTNVLDMASAIGIGSDAFSDFSYQFQVSLKGLSEEEALLKIQEEFAGVADAMAQLIPELEQFANEGETASQTLARLSSDLRTVNSAFSNLGRTALDASAQAAAAASRLISAAGGQGQFVSKTQTLVSNLLSPSEQLQFYQKKLVQESQFGYVPSEAEVKRIFQSGTMEQLETLYGGDTIETLNTIFQLQDQIAAEEERRKEEARRAAAAAAQEQARAAQAAAQAAKARRDAAAAAQKAIDDERIGLEKELLQLQGNIVELRRLELEAINPANRALQEMIWKLEDAKEAMEGINEIDFATLFDYQRAVAMARINMPANNMSQPVPMPMVVNGSATVSPEAIPTRTNEGTTAEDAAFIRQSLVEMIKYTKRTSDTLRKFDTDGLPPERT